MAAVLGSGTLLLLGGLSVLTGTYPLVGLALLALFFLGVTPAMHAYWKVHDPMQRAAEQVNFLKNMALLGACLALAAVPQPWPLNLPSTVGVLASAVALVAFVLSPRPPGMALRLVPRRTRR